MPLQPSRRDSSGPIPVIRQHQQALRSMDPGFNDGHRSTPQPVAPGPSELVGGDAGGGGDEENAVIGEDEDRLVLTHLGTQTWTLNYFPIAETIHVRFHPGGGAGVSWMRVDNYSIDDDDNVILITAEQLAAAHAEVGDVLSAQYLRLEGEQEETAPSVELRGSTSTDGTGSPPAGPLALHADAEIGDLVVISGASVDVTDARFAEIGASGIYVGTLDSLDGISYTNNAFHWCIAASVFTFGTPGATASSSGATNPGTLPQVTSQGLVIAGVVSGNVVPGTPTGFTLATNRGQGSTSVMIAYIHVTGTSPAASFASPDAWSAAVVTAPWEAGA